MRLLTTKRTVNGISQKTIYVICSVWMRIAYRTHMPCKLTKKKFSICRTKMKKISFHLIFNRFKCNRCANNVQQKLPPADSDCTSDLAQWYHCFDGKGMPDTILTTAWEVSKCVSFVFHHRSSKSEVKLEDVTEKVGQKKKKVYKDDDFDEDEDFEPEDDYERDEDFEL